MAGSQTLNLIWSSIGVAELDSLSSFPGKAGCFCWDEPHSQPGLIFVPKKTTADEAVHIESHPPTHTLPKLTPARAKVSSSPLLSHANAATPRDGDPVPAAPVAQTNGVEASFLGVGFGGDDGLGIDPGSMATCPRGFSRRH